VSFQFLDGVDLLLRLVRLAEMAVQQHARHGAKAYALAGLGGDRKRDVPPVAPLVGYSVPSGMWWK
jgi:hypothetical protein